MHPALPHHMVCRQEDTSAVDATREADADWFFLWNTIQPLGDFFREGCDIELTDSIKVTR